VPFDVYKQLNLRQL